MVSFLDLLELLFSVIGLAKCLTRTARNKSLLYKLFPRQDFSYYYQRNPVASATLQDGPVPLAMSHRLTKPCRQARETRSSDS